MIAGYAMIEPSSEVDAFAHETIGAAIEVHRHLGPGFLEKIYEEALCIELQKRKIPFGRQVSTRLFYKGAAVGDGRVDLLIGDQLIVEIKAVDELRPIHQAQVISYLRALDLQLGLLINFQKRRLKNGIQRVIYTK